MKKMAAYTQTQKKILLRLRLSPEKWLATAEFQTGLLDYERYLVGTWKTKRRNLQTARKLFNNFQSQPETSEVQIELKKQPVQRRPRSTVTVVKKPMG